jgi:anti-anti-sigma regulatory factor
VGERAPTAPRIGSVVVPDASHDVSFDEEARVLTLTGDLYDVSTATVRAALAHSTAEFTRDVRIELSTVTYLPSLMLRELVIALRRARGQGTVVQLAAAEGSVAARILGVTAIPFDLTGSG